MGNGFYGRGGGARKNPREVARAIGIPEEQGKFEAQPWEGGMLSRMRMSPHWTSLPSRK